MQYNFGQSVGGIIQTAFIVEDLKASIDYWVKVLGVGPWFVTESFKDDAAIYRGAQSHADVAIGMAFAGHMLIELIQPKDEHPSVYRETRDARGYGFHHFGVSTIDFDADLAAYEARGHSLAFLARVPTGDRVGYLDGGAGAPGFVELIESSELMESLFTRFWKASVDWNGDEPVRPFI